MSSASAFSRLCNELSARVTPALSAAGFSTDAPPFNRTVPCYDFKRRTERGQQVIRISFGKYRRPLFSVAIYNEPAAGLDHLVASGGTLVIGHLTAKYRRWPFPLLPFTAEPRWQRMLGRKDYVEAEAVTAFLDLLPEVEAWWANERSSRHILTGRLTYPGTRGADA